MYIDLSFTFRLKLDVVVIRGCVCQELYILIIHKVLTIISLLEWVYGNLKHCQFLFVLVMRCSRYQALVASELFLPINHKVL